MYDQSIHEKSCNQQLPKSILAYVERVITHSGVNTNLDLYCRHVERRSDGNVPPITENGAWSFRRRSWSMSMP